MTLGHWVGFFVAWAGLAQLLYLYVSRTLTERPLASVWDWLTMIGICALGLAAIVAITVILPQRRQRPRPARSG